MCIHCVSISKKHRKLILVCFGRMDRKCNRNSSNEAEDRLTYISLPKWLGILFIINDLQLVITSSVNAIIYGCLNFRLRKHFLVLLKDWFVQGQRHQLH